ncbi:MAG TPA: HAMP domain-containing sensor histidine kinase [Steroidobacteraceae bacterium]
MRPTRVFKTESFRSAALFATLFLILSWVLLGVVYWIVNNTQTAALVEAIDADISTIKNGYRGEGLPEAIEVIHQRLGSGKYSGEDLPGGYIVIRDEATAKHEGNLELQEFRLGLFSVPAPRSQKHRHRVTVLGRGVYIADGIYLFVGRDTSQIRATRVRIIQAFAWIEGVSIVLAGLGGIFFSVQFMRRIDAIARTCQSIIAGKFTDRIPLRGSGDELDTLSVAINNMLDRISTLLDNLRQVSSDVAHDLRTPLTHLRNRLEEARQKSVTTDDYAAVVSHAIGDTDHLLVIFSALLRISQIESGSRLAAFSTLSLTDILERIYDMYGAVAEDEHHVLQHDIQKDVRIRGDGELLTQMFSNLIENAIRHTPSGTRILIRLAVSGNTVAASVEDNGLGIPLGEYDKVFRRFYRLTSSRSTPGYGLGLALVAAIANLHNAKIELSDNRPGLRCVISFDYPSGSA